MDSKGPFYVFAVMLLVGNLAFLLVEVLEWPHFLLLACRVLMSLGFGAGFAAKRRAGLEPNVRRREYLFMLFELSASVGMASGPLLTGFLALAWPEEATLVPPVQMSIFGALFLVALCGCPLETPFTYTLAGADADAAPPPAAPAAPPPARELSEATPLVMGAKGLVPKGRPQRPRRRRRRRAAAAAAAVGVGDRAVGVPALRHRAQLPQVWVRVGDGRGVRPPVWLLGGLGRRPRRHVRALIHRLHLCVQRGVRLALLDGDAPPHRRAVSDHVGALHDRHRRHAAQRRRRRVHPRARTNTRRRATPPRAPTSSPPPRTGTPMPRTTRT